MNEKEIIKRMKQEVMDPISYSIPFIFEYTLIHNERLNIDMFSRYPSFDDFLIYLDDFCVVMVVELFVNCLDGHGARISDAPHFRDMMTEFYLRSGVHGVDFFEQIDESLTALDELCKNDTCEPDLVSEEYVMLRFLGVVAQYTDVRIVVSKVYYIIAKFYMSILDDEGNIDTVLSKYSDMIPLSELSENSIVSNEIIIEFVSDKLKRCKFTDMTFLEYANGKGIPDIYNKLTGGGELTDSIYFDDFEDMLYEKNDDIVGTFIVEMFRLIEDSMESRDPVKRLFSEMNMFTRLVSKGYADEYVIARAALHPYLANHKKTKTSMCTKHSLIEFVKYAIDDDRGLLLFEDKIICEAILNFVLRSQEYLLVESLMCIIFRIRRKKETDAISNMIQQIESWSEEDDIFVDPMIEIIHAEDLPASEERAVRDIMNKYYK